MSNFLVYSNQLRQYVPALSPEQAEDYVNQAWRDIRDSNDEWSFLYKQEYWLAPASIQLTGLTVTQFSNLVGLTHANLVQLAGLSNPPITLRQLRFGLTGGPIYSIADADVEQAADGDITATTTALTSAAGPFEAGDVGKKIRVAGAGVAGGNLDTTIAAFVSPTQVTLAAAAVTTVTGATVTWGLQLTLDRLFNESTSTSQQALCYRIYYSPLDATFARLDHLVDPIMGYEFGWEVGALDDLDRMDPQRSSVLQPYRVYFHHYDPVGGLPVYELWPGPGAQRAYPASIWTRGSDFSADTDSLPRQIPQELLMLRARLLAYEWAMTADPDLRMRQSYSAALGLVRSRYSTEGQPGRPLGLLDQVRRKDKSTYLKETRMFPRRPGPGWPVDARFLQSHAFPPGQWY